MEENTKTEQPLDDEQLQDVTGGGPLSFLGRGSRANSLSKMNNLQQDATTLSRGAATTKNRVFAQRMNEKAAMQMEELNNLNTKVRGF